MNIDPDRSRHIRGTITAEVVTEGIAQRRPSL